MPEALADHFLGFYLKSIFQSKTAWPATEIQLTLRIEDGDAIGSDFVKTGFIQ
ncbi:hypothetical protein GCM10028817_13700 [Spirosoma pomorum]